MELSWPIAIAFILYLGLMMSIGIYYSRQQKIYPLTYWETGKWAPG